VGVARGCLIALHQPDDHAGLEGHVQEESLGAGGSGTLVARGPRGSRRAGERKEDDGAPPGNHATRRPTPSS
jgi:hypothetical protein